MSEGGRDTGGGRDRDGAEEEDEKEDEKKGRDKGNSHNLHTDGVEQQEKTGKLPHIKPCPRSRG